MIDRQMKNQKGFTLIEMLLAMTLGLVLLAGTVYTYNKQDSLLRDENSNVQLRDFARLAMDELVTNIRLAGYGFPPGDSANARDSRAFTTAEATTLVYRANTEDKTTLAKADTTDTADNWVDVVSIADFDVDDNVVFFDTRNPGNWSEQRVDALDTVTPGLIWDSLEENGFLVQPLVSGVPVVVNKFHTITYNYDSVNQIITVKDDQGTDSTGDDVTTTIATNVSSLTFSYFDADGVAIPLPLDTDAKRGSIRRVFVSLTVADPMEPTMTARLDTDIHLRNLGL